MPLTIPVNTVAECLRTDCYILGDKKNIHGLRQCELHDGQYTAQSDGVV